MADLTIPTDAWVSVADADTFFKYRLNSDAWKNCAKDVKEAALVTAKRQLEILCPGTPTDPSQAMEDANCEQALFLLQQNGANDSRAGLMAQGVIAAGIVKEQYDPAKAGQLAIAPAARQLLKDFYTQAPGGVFGASLTRDEEA